MKALIVLLCLLTCAALSVRAQETQAPDSRVRHVVNQDVVEMVRAGLSPAVILAKLRSADCRFDTSPSALVSLKEAGVSDEILTEMVRNPYGASQTSPTTLAAEPQHVAAAKAAHSKETLRARHTFPPRGEYRHKKTIEATYDRFTNKTTVHLRTLNLGAVYGLRMVAAFSYPGTELIQPEDVVLAFFSSSSTWRFLRNRNLVVILDGERIDLGEAVRADSDVHRGGVSESLGIFLPLETFLKLVTANTVDAQLGSYEFSLADDHIQALRDFASRMQP